MRRQQRRHGDQDQPEGDQHVDRHPVAQTSRQGEGGAEQKPAGHQHQARLRRRQPLDCLHKKRHQIGGCEDAGAEDKTDDCRRRKSGIGEQAQIEQRLADQQLPENEPRRSCERTAKQQDDVYRAPTFALTIGKRGQQARQRQHHQGKARPIEAGSLGVALAHRIDGHGQRHADQREGNGQVENVTPIEAVDQKSPHERAGRGGEDDAEAEDTHSRATLVGREDPKHRDHGKRLDNARGRSPA